MSAAAAGQLQWVRVCLYIFFGLVLVVMGTIYYYEIGHTFPYIQSVFIAVFVIGILLLLFGAIKIPGVRKEIARWQSVVRIAAVRKEVSISDISYETGLDSEYVREILTKCLMNGFLHGYIEGDLFVRDTSGTPVYPRGQTGLFSLEDD